jgi:CelD/BcsL family acetyltransferase involved in cellulose biosynthesis
MLDTELIADLETLEGLTAEWDALAAVNALPLMSPAWIMAWWAHLAASTAEPRVVVAREAGTIVGLAPFFSEPDARVGRLDYRMPGISVGRAPLALPGREWEVAQAIGSALAEADPPPDAIVLEATPLVSYWHLSLRECWPGSSRPLAYQYRVRWCPTVSLAAGSYEDWLKQKSAHFRARMRRSRRQFAAAGGSVRLSTRETLRADIATLIRLHGERWHDRGGSEFLTRGGDRLASMLEQAGNALVDDGRFRLIILEVEGQPISAQLATGAGGEVLGIIGGWDERFARMSPQVLGILATIEDALERGDRRLNMSVGQQAYKQRIADGIEPVVWSVVVPTGRRLPLTAARIGLMLAGKAARDTARRALSPKQTGRLPGAGRGAGRADPRDPVP